MTTPFRLYYFFQRNCGACSEAAPAMRAFRGAHATDGIVVEVDANARPELLGFTPKGTPAYLLRVGIDEDETIALKTIGALREKDLEKMLQDARKKWEQKYGAGAGGKKRKRKKAAAAEEDDDVGEEADDGEVGDDDEPEEDEDE